MRKPIMTIIAGFLALFAFTPSAEAAPADGSRPAVRSVCETGFRGQPAYDRKCLRTGNVLDGINLWFREGGARNGKIYSADTRREFCQMAKGAPTLRAGIIDGLFDVAYDHYRNHKFVLSIAATVGVADCKSLGIRFTR